jgi:hypothetical protein
MKIRSGGASVRDAAPGWQVRRAQPAGAGRSLSSNHRAAEEGVPPYDFEEALDRARWLEVNTEYALEKPRNDPAHVPQPSP